ADAGYGHTQAGIWTASGELVALSRQTVTVFG
ncbi:MAG: acyl-CoA thioesterase II, partial [Marinobacter sp.]|nr:acyl-CoA thioesterase II [Marinobacter sp.]